MPSVILPTYLPTYLQLAFRFMIGIGALFSSLILAIPTSIIVIRILTSGLFWRAVRAYIPTYTHTTYLPTYLHTYIQHGLWSRVVYGPLPLKVVLYQYIARVGR